MSLTVSDLMPLLRETLISPRKGARMILDLGLAARVGWLALALMAVGSAILTHLTMVMMSPEAVAYWGGAMGSPVNTAILQWVVMFVTVHAVHRLGRMRGGAGTLAESVVLVAWLQFVLLALQALQLVVQVILPPFAQLLGLAGLGLFFWLLTNFVAEIHGFKSLGAVFASVVFVMILASMVMVFVFSIFYGDPTAGM
ncbi:MAG: YIP1 family protein [Pseudorhodobacter sp.]|nr:YIP1 family protein [Pseudorhodobacter sp.]